MSPSLFHPAVAISPPMYDYVSVTTGDAGAPTPVRDGTIKLHDEAGFAGMRKAGRLSAEILDALVPFVQPGVTTAAIDDLVRTMMLDGGGIPATLGSRGFKTGKASCRERDWQYV